MSDIWVTIPLSDVRVQTPKSMADRHIKLIFRDVESINSVIDQLESIKEMMVDSEELCQQIKNSIFI